MELSSPSEAELLDAYALFEQFEKQTGEIYVKLHHRFQEQPSLAALWWEMGADEFDHASLLEFCRERRILSPVKISADTVRGIEQMFQQLDETLDSNEVTLEEAFLISIVLESSELDATFSSLIGRLESPYYIISVRQRCSLKSHIDRLFQAALNYCPTPRVLRALDQMGDSQ